MAMGSEVPAAAWLAAGAAGWRMGHDDVRVGRLSAERIAREHGTPWAEDGPLAARAADAARAYTQRAATQSGLTPAQGVRLTMVFLRAYIRGALDEALDAGALDQRRW